VDLDRHALADLVRLKGALDHALLQASDRSEHGCHAALISLDGVLEYAMRLAMLHREIRVTSQTSFVQIFDALRESLDSNWKPSRRGLIEIHNARNQTQHGRVTPDPARLDGWADEVDGFVKSLVVTAFGVALDDVLLAEAVTDDELRQLVAQAELAVSSGESKRGFDIACKALTAARRRWREQQEDAYGYMALRSSLDEEPLQLSPDQRAAEYGDVGVFTSDLGEYHWLTATRRLFAQGVPPTVEDARRALQFAYHWILRWQQFDARYPRERWRAYFDSLEPPTTGDGDSPQIAWVQVLGEQMVGSIRSNKLLVQIANIPDRGRGDWGEDINQAVALAAEDVQQPSHKLIAGERSFTGQFTFFAEHELKAESLIEWLRLVVAETTRLYRARREHVEQREREAEILGIELTEIFARHGELFGAVSTRYVLRPGGEIIAAEIDYLGSRHELSDIVGIFGNRGGVLAGTWLSDGRLAFDASPLDSESRAVLEEAIEATADHVRGLRDFARETESRRRALEKTMQASLGAPAERSRSTSDSREH
jgi:hypothetical protein